MTEVIVNTVLVLAVVWPLLLAAAIVNHATRGMAVALAPWAALPALAAALVPETALQLPGVLMDSRLHLDSIGRVFLLLSASLWLATGLLARPLLSGHDSYRGTVLLLLAIAGGVAMPLAADAVLFFAASTITAYSLYGLLVHDGDAVRIGRVFVVLLVLSDVVIFELLLVLAQASGSVEFASMRQGYADTHGQTLTLVLFVVGFGIKIGLAGFHFSPIMTSSRRALRPALVSFVFTAGLLGWLRLLPKDVMDWPTAVTVLQWLAVIAVGAFVARSRYLREAIEQSRKLATVHLPAWRDAWFGFLKSAWSKLEFWRVLDRLESDLCRWRNVLQILLLLGLIAAWLGASA